jgi:hypothetical protein
MVIKCGETNNEALQLAVVRALLTFTTAEHFIAHGECLLAAVRAMFNLALGSENPVNKRTACNALLQVRGAALTAVLYCCFQCISASILLPTCCAHVSAGA